MKRKHKSKIHKHTHRISQILLGSSIVLAFVLVLAVLFLPKHPQPNRSSAFGSRQVVTENPSYAPGSTVGFRFSGFDPITKVFICDDKYGQLVDNPFADIESCGSGIQSAPVGTTDSSGSVVVVKHLKTNVIVGNYDFQTGYGNGSIGPRATVTVANNIRGSAVNASIALTNQPARGYFIVGEYAKFSIQNGPKDTYACYEMKGTTACNGATTIGSNGEGIIATRGFIKTDVSDDYPISVFFRDKSKNDIGYGAGGYSTTIKIKADESGADGGVYAGGTKTVLPDKASYKQGDSIQFLVKGFPGNTAVAICFNNDGCNKADGDATTGTTTGSVVIQKAVPSGTTPGTYDYQVYYHDVAGKEKLWGTVPVVVVAGSGSGSNTSNATLSVTPSKVEFGSNETVNVTFKITGAASGANYCITEGTKCEGDDISGEIGTDGTAIETVSLIKSEVTKGVVIFSAFITESGITKEAKNTTINIIDGGDTSGGGTGGSGDPCETVSHSNWPVITKTKGTSNDANAVKCIQNLLKQHYGSSGSSIPTDGKYTSSTWDYVYSFQEEKHLKIDGDVGSETWPVLFGAASGSGPTGTGPSDTNPPPPNAVDTGDGTTTCPDKLVAHNGLCFPPRPVNGSGLITCDTFGKCATMLINGFLTLAGIMAVIIIIIGGYQYLTSAGNEERATKGRKTLTYAFIGLAAVILAYTLVSVVTQSLVIGLF